MKISSIPRRLYSLSREKLHLWPGIFVGPFFLTRYLTKDKWLDRIEKAIDVRITEIVEDDDRLGANRIILQQEGYHHFILYVGGNIWT